jgi:hypothetical protein
MEQAITTFNHAAEEMRFHLNHQWLITNYAMLAYAGLVVATSFVDKNRYGWRTAVNVVAVVLVVLAAWQAWRYLAYSNDIRVLQSSRLEKAIEHLPLICRIHEKQPPRPREGRSPLVRNLQALFAFSVRRDELPRFSWGLFAVVGLGAAFASQIIISRLARRPRVLWRSWRSHFQYHWMVYVLESWVLVGLIGAALLLIPSPFPSAERSLTCISKSGSVVSWPSS